MVALATNVDRIRRRARSARSNCHPVSRRPRGATPKRGETSRRLNENPPIKREIGANFEQIPVFDSDPYEYGTPLPAIAGTRPEAAGA